jgi:hypothetical protein
MYTQAPKQPPRQDEIFSRKQTQAPPTDMPETPVQNQNKPLRQEPPENSAAKSQISGQNLAGQNDILGQNVSSQNLSGLNVSGLNAERSKNVASVQRGVRPVMVTAVYRSDTRPSQVCYSDFHNDCLFFSFEC